MIEGGSVEGSRLWSHSKWTTMRDLLATVSALFLLSSTLPLLATPPITPPVAPELATRQAIRPRPLAVLNGSVDDFYMGDLYTAFTMGQRHTASLMFFYAPWDAVSHHMARLVSRAAPLLLMADVYVAAINCWNLEGDCRRIFMENNRNNRELPILAIYPKEGSGLLYKGSNTLSSLISFVSEVVTPIKVLRSMEQLESFKSEYKTLVIAYFVDLNNLDWFVTSSLKMLEEDPRRHHVHSFNIVLNQSLANEMGLSESTPIKIISLNEDNEMADEMFQLNKVNRVQNESMSSVLVNWTRSKSRPLVAWTSTSGKKSLKVGKLFAKSNYTLIAFVKKKDHKHIKDIKDVLAVYLKCNTSSARTSIKSSSNGTFHLCNEDVVILQTFCDLRPRSCLCQHYKASDESMTPSDHHEDWRSSSFVLNCLSYLLEVHIDECRSDSSHKTNPQPEVLETSGLEGLGCGSNKSLQSVFFDIDDDRVLAASLGLRKSEGPAVIIVDWIRQLVYHLDKAVDKVTLSHFLLHFHSNESSLNLLRMEEDVERSNGRRGQHSERLEAGERLETSIESLNTSSLLRSLSSSSEHLLLLYTSPSCVFSSTLSHIFLALQQLLVDLHLQHVVRVARIDSNSNDLPWQWSELALPSVLFVPRHRRDETRAFPQHREVNLTNLISFVVANLDDNERRALANALCDHDCKKARAFRDTLHLFQPRSEQWRPVVQERATSNKDFNSINEQPTVISHSEL